MDAHLMTRRDEVASAVIATWVVTGLFLDGWAHNAGKPEDFFTPWHGVLYSGFLAGGIWALAERARSRRLGLPVAPVPPSMRIGFGLFAAAGVGDLLWHQVFGVEESIEALLSPTHLGLMVGGLILSTATVRSALARGVRSPRLRELAPAVVGVTLAVAIVAFFLQFSSALRIDDHEVFLGTADDAVQVRGIVAVLLTNALVLGGTAWVLRRWAPPPGTFTVMFTGMALLMSGLYAFDQVALVVPFLAGGLVADVLAGRRSARTVLVATPVVLWLTWFGVYHAVWGLGWAVELWTGSVVFAALTGWGFSLLTEPVAPAAGRTSSDPGPPEVDVTDEPEMPTAPVRTPRRTLAEALR